jgi:FkbM family methyltransferase
VKAALSTITTAAGLTKSFLIYYGIPGRLRKMKSLYSRFLSPGSLCFDIGSHLGNRIRAWHALGATIVASEPEPHCFAVLNRFYGKKENIHLLQTGLGSRQGEATLYICDTSPTLSTLSTRWMNTVQTVASFEGIRWDRTETVPVTTLDRLIEMYGVPEFIKIDVEGYEAEVLRGLTVPVRTISFEYLPASIRVAYEAVEELDRIGNYHFNISVRETMELSWDEWHTKERLIAYFDSLEPGDPSGDVYARMR